MNTHSAPSHFPILIVYVDEPNTLFLLRHPNQVDQGRQFYIEELRVDYDRRTQVRRTHPERRSA